MLGNLVGNMALGLLNCYLIRQIVCRDGQDSYSCFCMHTSLLCDFAILLNRKWSLFSFPLNLGWLCGLPYLIEYITNDTGQLLCLGLKGHFSFCFHPSGTWYQPFKEAQATRGRMRPLGTETNPLILCSLWKSS